MKKISVEFMQIIEKSTIAPIKRVYVLIVNGPSTTLSHFSNEKSQLVSKIKTSLDSQDFVDTQHQDILKMRK